MSKVGGETEREREARGRKSTVKTRECCSVNEAGEKHWREARGKMYNTVSWGREREKRGESASDVTRGREK